MEFAGCQVLAVGGDPKRAGHAEMHEQAPRPMTDRPDRYFARRPRPVTICPCSRATKSFGSGQRRSGRRASTRSMRAPSITGARPRRTVSTSGNSGIGAAFTKRDRPVIAPLRAPRYGPPERIHSMPQTGRDTHFGFREVPLEDKQALVDDVFHSVARRYDLMNDLMSGGLHRAWKDMLVTAVNPPKSDRAFHLLDVAGGTGDIALARDRRRRRRNARDYRRRQSRHAGRRPRTRRRARTRSTPSLSPRAMPNPCRFQTARSTPIRSRSASATCRASSTRLPKRCACCGRAGNSSAWNFLPSTCRDSTRCTISIRSMSFRRWAAIGRR